MSNNSIACLVHVSDVEYVHNGHLFTNFILYMASLYHSSMLDDTSEQHIDGYPQ